MPAATASERDRGTAHETSARTRGRSKDVVTVGQYPSEPAGSPRELEALVKVAATGSRSRRAGVPAGTVGCIVVASVRGPRRGQRGLRDERHQEIEALEGLEGGLLDAGAGP